MDSRPSYRSHLLPRTPAGRTATVAFLVLFALCMPPVTHTVLNRTDPWLLGFPFLYTTLLFVYVALIAVLLWAWRRGL